MIPEASRKAIEEKVDQFNPVISARASALAEALGTYGFQGKVSITLSVSVEDKNNGSEEVFVERKTDLRFKR